MTVPTLARELVLRSRAHAQQLGRTAGTVADTAVLDLGVQDSGTDGAAWALALRGLADPPPAELALAWTLRGAPHAYRRADLPGVAAATTPFSDDDAATRVFDASKPLRAAGIPVLEALDTVAAAMRDVVREPTVKGALSGALNARLPAPYQRFCRPCGAVHVYEQPFRLASLRAGLELEPGTSPPVLRPLPGFAPATEVPAHLDVVRGCLRLLGPATPAQVAGFLDARVADVKAHWPADAVEVDVAGERRSLVGEPVDAPLPDGVLLLGPFDLFLQGRDRDLLVPDRARAKELWPVLGRPGAVLAGAEVAGTWRPRKAGRKLALAVTPWAPIDRSALDEAAERLAAFRGLELASVDLDV